jgi:hypothetical protein
MGKLVNVGELQKSCALFLPSSYLAIRLLSSYINYYYYYFIIITFTLDIYNYIPETSHAYRVEV